MPPSRIRDSLHGLETTCQMPGRQPEVRKCPTPGTGNIRKCPGVARGGWALLELTDALQLLFFFNVSRRGNLRKPKCNIGDHRERIFWYFCNRSWGNSLLIVIYLFYICNITRGQDVVCDLRTWQHCFSRFEPFKRMYESGAKIALKF